jgi:outer membrane immunogenic protein
MKRFLISTAAVFGFATAAAAADLPEPVDQPAPEVYGPTVFNWTGPYIGASIGGAFGNSSTRPTGFGSQDINMNGVIGGLYAGYNYQFTPNFLLGAEGNFDFTSQEGDKRFNAGGASLRVKQRAEWLAGIRARAGVTFDRFLVFGTGGVAFTGLQTDVRGFGSKTENKVGWTIGAGGEYAITDNIIGRIEYQFVDFGDSTTSFRGRGGGRVRSDLTDNIVKAGISYKF